MDVEEPDCATLPCQFFHHALCLPPQTSYHEGKNNKFNMGYNHHATRGKQGMRNTCIEKEKRKKENSIHVI